MGGTPNRDCKAHEDLKMRHILLMFLDGVGLGTADSRHNPFASAKLPNLAALFHGRTLVHGTPRFSTDLISFVPTDPLLEVTGYPQSATGQAAIVTGLNVPKMIGKHWGPKPNTEIQRIVCADNLCLRLVSQGHSLRLANAYPPSFFDGIQSGRRSYSVLQLAFATAGISLYTADDLRSGRAFSADLSGHTWRSQLKIRDAPLYSPEEAGRRLANEAKRHSLVLFDYWMSDVVGHRGSIKEAIELVENIDAAVGGIMSEWDMSQGMVIIVSDHGNIEDMSTRHHTLNPVPTLLIGGCHASMASSIHALTDLLSVITKYLSGPSQVRAPRISVPISAYKSRLS